MTLDKVFNIFMSRFTLVKWGTKIGLFFLSQSAVMKIKLQTRKVERQNHCVK